MKMMEDKLPANRFIRIHRSFIVQKQKIKIIEKGHIGNFDHAMELIRIAEFPEELILNRSSGEFLSWLEKWNTLQIK